MIMEVKHIAIAFLLAEYSIYMMKYLYLQT